MSQLSRSCGSALIVVMLTISVVSAAPSGGQNRSAPTKGSQSLGKSTVIQAGTFEGNRVYTDFENNGMIVSPRPSGHAGMEWPRGSLQFSNYASGLWVGGKVGTEVRVSASVYASEFVPGSYNSDPLDPSNRAYKVERGPVEAVRNGAISPTVYTDIMEWPAADGAPFIDIDGDGIYEPLEGDTPEMIGDQFIWFVINDGDASAHTVFPSAPLGIEIQVSMWGVDRSNELGDVIFVSYKIINKSGVTITESYVSMWDDPDLGDAIDDYTASDPERNMGYAYNDGPDASYGEGGGAIGYVLLDGPENLGMTAYTIFDNNTVDHNWGDPNSAEGAYNSMRGFYPSGTPYINSETGQATKILYPDHPRDSQGTGDGWAEVDDHPSGDKRMLLSSGPFTFSAGETQEVTFAIAHALGADSFASIDLLQQVADLAQDQFDFNFDQRTFDAIPTATVSALDQSIALSWGAESEGVTHAHVFGDDWHEFEGYNVWQYADADGSDPILIATYDIINGTRAIQDSLFVPALQQVVIHTTHHGTDSGIRRYYRFEEDSYTGQPLNNNQTYFVGATAYAYNDDLQPRVIETEANVQSIMPLGLVAGIDATLTEGSQLAAHTSGTAPGTVEVTVFDPKLVTGDTYEVTFKNSGNSFLWDLRNISLNADVLTDQSLFTERAIIELVDGLIIKVESAPVGVNDWGYDGNRWVGGTDWGGSQFFGGLDIGALFFGDDGTIGRTDYVPVLLEFQDSTDIVDNGFAGKGYMYRRDLGYAYAGIGDMPFTAWEIDYADYLAGTFTKLRQLNVVFAEDAVNGNANQIWDMGTDATGVVGSVDGAWGVIPPVQGGREYTMIMSSTYDADAGTTYDDNNWGMAADVMYAFWPQGRSRVYGIDPFTMWVIPNQVMTTSDIFEFTTIAPTVYTPTKGDANLDGTVDIADVVTLVNMILHIAEGTGEQQYAADFNSDHRLEVTDVVGIVRSVLGLSKTVGSSAASLATVSLPAEVGGSEGRFDLPINISADGDISGVQLTMRFDEEITKPLDLIVDESWSGITAMQAEVSKGKVTYLLYNFGGGGLPVDRLLTVPFEMMLESSDAPTIAISSVVLSNASGEAVKIEYGNRETALTALPLNFALHPNYPNPFNPSTTIRYDMPKAAEATIVVYNLLGEHVNTLVHGEVAAGQQSVVWNGRDNTGRPVSTGMYIVRMQADGQLFHHKILLLK